MTVALGQISTGVRIRMKGAFTQAEVSHEAKTVPASMEWTALLLAGTVIVIGFTATDIFTLVEIGMPFGHVEVKP